MQLRCAACWWAIAGGSLVAGTAAAAAATRGTVVTSSSAAAGPADGGARLTVHVKDLYDVARVMFGSSPGRRMHVVSATKLQVTTPRHAAGRVNDRLAPHEGTISPIDSAGRYTFVARPTVSRLSAQTGPVTDGRAVTITGSHFVHGAAVEFGTIQPTTSQSRRLAGSR